MTSLRDVGFGIHCKVSGGDRRFNRGVVDWVCWVGLVLLVGGCVFGFGFFIWVGWCGVVIQWIFIFALIGD